MDELELMITVVVAADDDRAARRACQSLLHRVGGRIVECGDCSDEEPGCWSVTISLPASSSGAGPAALSRAVRTFLRELGPEFPRHRVSCESPTAWSVVDDPELVEALVPGGERLLVEAWVGDAGAPVFADEDPDLLPPPEPEPGLADVDEHGRVRPRLGMVVDVVTQRHAAAEWPARAVASRVSRSVTLLGSAERPPMVRVEWDLGPAEGEPAEIVADAVARLGGVGWSRPRAGASVATARWSAAPTPPSGIAAIELTSTVPSMVDSGTPHWNTGSVS
ncbi:hypothetical protein GIY23_02720 [Allosaccharopolyspora coralli]|uniref:Uncharacterized protein n=1 Tax=Allosaccharopolyspora coralli TaxID=2665642 RepID=A0A5Q3QAW6_9PSEU|nr:hypothetical protein [Allosaccharopolyspora coralli]QGK68615.1 hypothetical protein GIY23_02720 [Allosaccharopolyspora coralli]